MEEGWGLIISKSFGQKRKSHYFIDNKSLCGSFKPNIVELTELKIVDKSEIFIRKICKVCESHFKVMYVE